MEGCEEEYALSGRTPRCCMDTYLAKEVKLGRVACRLKCSQLSQAHISHYSQIPPLWGVASDSCPEGPVLMMAKSRHYVFEVLIVGSHNQFSFKVAWVVRPGSRSMKVYWLCTQIKEILINIQDNKTFNK